MPFFDWVKTVEALKWAMDRGWDKAPLQTKLAFTALLFFLIVVLVHVSAIPLVKLGFLVILALGLGLLSLLISEFAGQSEAKELGKYAAWALSALLLLGTLAFFLAVWVGWPRPFAA